MAKKENQTAKAESQKSVEKENKVVAEKETNQGLEIARAISEGLKDAKGEKFELGDDDGVEHRFSVVRDKKTGEVFTRDNSDGTLSRLQLESLEEKEASLKNREVEEV